jgi:hypothetical protein
MNTDGFEILMRRAGCLPAGAQGEVSERSGRRGMSDRRAGRDAGD